MAGAPLLSALLAVVWARCISAASEGKKAAGGRRQGTQKLLYPIHLSSVRLSGPDAFEPQGFADDLADIGLRRFREFLSSTLPKELEADPMFAEEFHRSDHSRINLAFIRWQKRVFSLAKGIPLRELSYAGERLIMHEGINYTWPELYNSRSFARLGQRITEMARLFLTRTGYPSDKNRNFRIFIWAEVYAHGDSLRPGAHSAAAYMMGRYFAAGEKGSLKLNFADPRGINPPYGKTYSHAPFMGNLVLYPTWASHFITPNMLNKTAVCYAFHVYPEGDRLDWEDDRTGSIVITSPLKPPPDLPPRGRPGPRR